MATTVALRHDTGYRYDRPVLLGPQTIRLRPSARPGIGAYALEVGPNPATLRWLHDPLGNLQGHAVVLGETGSLDIGVRLVAELAPRNPFDFLLDVEVAEWPFRYPGFLARALLPFLSQGVPGPDDAGPEALAREMAEGPGGTLDLLLRCNAELNRRVAYVTRLAHGVQAPGETLRLGRGSCRDSAWLLVDLLRRLGFAARFCSGYLIELDTETQGDRADLHAWAEAWLPGAGWIGLDATSGLLCAEGHIPLAAGPDPAFCAPVTGTHTRAEVELSFALSVERLPAGPDPGRAPGQDRNNGQGRE